MKSRRILIKITLMVLCGILVNFVPKLNVTYAVSEKDDKKIKISMSKVIKDGVYYINCASNSNYVLDIENGSIDNTANLQIYQKNGNLNQKFYIKYVGDGYYKIINIKSAKALDVQDGKSDLKTNIRQYEYNNSSAQKWKIRKNIDGTYNFIAECSGKAMDIAGAKFKNNTNIQQYEYNNSQAQKFKLESTEILNEGIIAIRKADKTNLVVDINNGSTADGTKAKMYQNNDSTAQRFEIHRVDENEVRIRTAASGGWLKEKENKISTDVVQSGNGNTHSTNSDTWKIEWDDGIKFINKESGLALDIQDNGSANDTRLQVYTKSNKQSQRFLVTEEDLIKSDWYEIRSALGTNLDLANGKKDLGTNIQTYTVSDTNNQRFNIVKTVNGYKILTKHKLALDVENASTKDQANIRQWEDNGTNCQYWIPEITDGGYISFRNKNSGKYIDVANGSSAARANVWQYTGNKSKSQSWKLIKTELKPEIDERFADAWGEDWHTDTTYLQTIIDKANSKGSDTNWFVAVDVNRFRVVVVRKDNNKNMWKIDGCFNATMGTLGSNGKSATGVFNETGNSEMDTRVTHKTATTAEGNLWFTSYIDCRQADGTDDSQGFHNAYEASGQTFSSHGCPRLTDAHAKYIYDNVDINSKVTVWQQ